MENLTYAQGKQSPDTLALVVLALDWIRRGWENLTYAQGKQSPDTLALVVLALDKKGLKAPADGYK